MANQNLKKYVTDLIGDAYQSWKPGNSIILQSGTGTGKSTFCIETLLPYCQANNKKLLYVCNRISLEKDITARLKEFIELHPEISADYITITKYQDIEAKFRSSKDSEVISKIADMSYIFLDECHYFVSDAPMNAYTEYTYNLFRSNADSVLIYASATANEFFNNLIKEEKIPKSRIYEIPQDYSFVDNVYLYRDKQLLSIIGNIIDTEKDSKIVVFCKDGNKIMDIYRTFGDKLVDVICAKNYSDKRVKEIANMKALKDSSFSKRILATTSVIDNGIDFKDPKIKHMISELPTMDSLIQSLGRKRPASEDDHCNYYIREYSVEEIKKMHRPIKDQLTPAVLWKKNPDSFYNAYKKRKDVFKLNNIMYFDSELKSPAVNNMAFVRYLITSRLYDQIEKHGYKSVLTKYLEPSLRNRIKISDAKDYEDEFLVYLSSIEGKKIFRDSLDEVKEKFAAHMEKMGKKSKHVGIASMNAYLEETYEQRYKSRFNSVRDMNRKLPDGSPNPNRLKTYYVLQ